MRTLTWPIPLATARPIGSRWLLGILLVACALALAGCAAERTAIAPILGPALRIGVVDDYPPVAFRNDEGLAGIEIDLARAVSRELGRHPEFVEMDFQALIPALEAGRIDVIMSGMSITDERRTRVLFAEPYMRMGQLALIRKADIGRFGNPVSLRRRGSLVGYVRGTTGADFVERDLPRAEAYAFDSADDGVRSLRAKRIDYFIHDAPTIWRIALGTHETDLIGIFRPLTEEELAWAVALDDMELLEQLNGALEKWSNSNRVQAIVNKWIPVRVTTAR
jgi:ABC-type amino acid transport substrate-binding protein